MILYEIMIPLRFGVYILTFTNKPTTQIIALGPFVIYKKYSTNIHNTFHQNNCIKSILTLVF